MLLAIKDYLQTHPHATAAELGWQFKTSPEIIHSIVAVLQRKGVVRSLSAASCDGCQQSCTSCPLKS